MVSSLFTASLGTAIFLVRYCSASSSTEASIFPRVLSYPVSRAVPALPKGWTYQGCYVDGANGRDLNYQYPDSTNLTIEACITECSAIGYSVAGLEYASQCFCDTNLRNGATLATSDTDCNTPCSGNNAEECGGGNRLSVYANHTVEILQPPSSQNTSLPGSWQYQGCIV